MECLCTNDSLFNALLFRDFIQLLIYFHAFAIQHISWLCTMLLNNIEDECSCIQMRIWVVVVGIVGMLHKWMTIFIKSVIDSLYLEEAIHCNNKEFIREYQQWVTHWLHKFRCGAAYELVAHRPCWVTFVHSKIKYSLIMRMIHS